MDLEQRVIENVRQVGVTDPIASGRRFDYADAVEVELGEADRDAPEAWVRAGLADSPALVKRITSLLGVGRTPDSDGIAGFKVIESNADVVHLEQTLPLMHVIVVGRNIGLSTRTFTTLLTYERPIARLLWAVVGVAHRRTARRLITAKAVDGTAEVGGDGRG
ncbi:hypothetical protein OG394_24175 [Kribbella sp. NBC_01245]|uniref:hypothetical protein n=1 Tax=Kribbella sp. NBC_01245 TaxID=2903578 RepID=UPI002E2C7493|nr:hypothetical protein [Kribbella sp. NBC_01245]